MKHILRAPRPKVFFDLENNPDAFPIVEGVNLHSSNSFPSGHTCTFFILFFILAIVIIYYHGDMKNSSRKLLQLGCFLLAVVGAYSRIYLSQHFALDIFAGSTIGCLVVIALYPAFLWFNNRFPKVCVWHIALPKQRKEQGKQE